MAQPPPPRSDNIALSSPLVFFLFLCGLVVSSADDKKGGPLYIFLFDGWDQTSYQRSLPLFACTELVLKTACLGVGGGVVVKYTKGYLQKNGASTVQVYSRLTPAPGFKLSMQISQALPIIHIINAYILRPING
jgi:hypothetical protein